MKIWNSYGTEHSLDLVIIGKFTNASEASEFHTLVNEITDFLSDNESFEIGATKYDRETLDFLMNKNIVSLSPEQLGHFILDVNVELESNQVRISSDDDVNAFISLLIHQGAKVEVFSRHHHEEN